MNNIFKDIWSVISSMSFIDFVLYFAVITLIVLIVSLIYVIYMEKLEEEEKENVTLEVPKTEEKKLVVPIEEEKKEKDDFDLLSIIDEINENPKPLIDMTAYEEEQEKKAIISYDELLKSANKELNYDKEELVDDVIPVKKLTLSNIEIPKEITYVPKEPKIEIESPTEKSTSSVPLFSYEKEEAFLKALQQLNELLN